MICPSTQGGARRVDTPLDNLPLESAASTRLLEQHLREGPAPGNALQAQAGLSLARWIRAWAPHARHVVVACGPGGNGGDGLYACAYLQEAGIHARAWLVQRAFTSAQGQDRALAAAVAAGALISHHAPSQEPVDVVVDAILGVGARSPLGGAVEDAVQVLNTYRKLGVTVLAADIPTGLGADQGAVTDNAVHAHATLSLLTLKPGLFTASGRRVSGDIWWDPLIGRDSTASPPRAWLTGLNQVLSTHRRREATDHKGSMGDVLVVGGAAGMWGAAWLAASAALGAGSGRVFVYWLSDTAPRDPSRPEIMHSTSPLKTGDPAQASRLTVVCGCGGGQEIREVLPWVLAHSPRLVLDADALNAVANDSQLQAQLRLRHGRQRPTVLTPHPLEAARLLNCTVKQVQSERLGCAQQLADQLQCTVVLKGSGTVIASPAQIPRINPTGSATLASPGTGDVLAGWLGGAWSQMPLSEPVDLAGAAVWLHGLAGQLAPVGSRQSYQALELISQMRILRDQWLNVP